MGYLPGIDTLPGEPWAPGAPGTRHGELVGRRFRANGTEVAALLLIHGVGEHHGRYARQIKHLTQRGVTVHAFDLPGHGRTRGTRALVDVNGLVGLAHTGLLSVRDYARSAGIPTLVLGHSMGGLLAAALATRVPAALDGAFLSAPALLVGAGYPEWYKRLGDRMGRYIPAFPAAKIDVEGGLSHIREYVEDYKTDPLVYHGAIPARTAATMLALAENTRPQAGSLLAPVTIIHGDADPIVDIAGSREFAQRSRRACECRGVPPLVRLTEFAGGLHELFNDRDSAAAYAELDRWLETVVPADSAGP